MSAVAKGITIGYLGKALVTGTQSKCFSRVYSKYITAYKTTAQENNNLITYFTVERGCNLLYN